MNEINSIILRQGDRWFRLKRKTATRAQFRTLLNFSRSMGVNSMVVDEKDMVAKMFVKPPFDWDTLETVEA